MHATVRRNEAVVGKWTDELNPETRQAVVRDLLEFEGFRSPNRRMKQPGSRAPG